ncbi:MAG: energy transducer TonB [Rhodothermales bacterium]|nr:energy transducer TonB [Rhodothermales bacterium]
MSRTQSVRERNEAYLSRFLAALAGSTLLALILVNLPLPQGAPDRVGWQVIDSNEIIALENVRFEEGLSAAPGILFSDVPPIVRDEVAPESPSEGALDDEVASEDPGTDVPRSLSRVQRVERLVLAAAETMPEIKGGLGAYYINIKYPQLAIEAGIQGRLVLDFVVEPDGRATNVEVYQSLHPMCDSAAVQALRKTVFMPGRSGGEAVAVKMRLPVLFRIMQTGGSQSDSLSSGI